MPQCPYCSLIGNQDKVDSHIAKFHKNKSGEVINVVSQDSQPGIADRKGLMIQYLKQRKEQLYEAGFSYNGKKYPFTISAMQDYFSKKECFEQGIVTTVEVDDVTGETITLNATEFNAFYNKALTASQKVLNRANRIARSLEKVSSSEELDTLQSSINTLGQ